MQKMKKNLRSYIYLLTIGFFIGAADPIPGVSGGTIAFISGIYDKLIKTLKSFNLEWFKLLITFRWKLALQKIDWVFLIPLLLGVVLALLLVSNLIHYFLDNHSLYLWSFFFGLVFLSSLLLTSKIPTELLAFWLLLLGALLGYFLVGLVPTTTPNSYWFIFLCGSVAVTALLLPGISGSFILVILGKYTLIISAIKNPFMLDNLIVLAVFYFGMLFGLLLFVNFLDFMMKHWRANILALLIGVTFGTLRKLWPWKDTVLEQLNRIPDFSSQTLIAVFFMLVGAALSLFIFKLPKFLKL